MSTPQLQDIIQQFMDAGSEFTPWNAAAQQLQAFAKDGLSLADGIAMLQAASSGQFPKQKNQMFDTAARFIQAVSQKFYPEYAPLLRDAFLSFGKRARMDVMVALANAQMPEASRAWMDIVKTYGPRGEVPALAARLLTQKPRDPEIFFPDLLTYASIPGLQFDIYLLTLTYCQKRLISPDMLIPFADGILESYRQAKTQMLAARMAHPSSWRTEEDYFTANRLVGLFLDLMGYVPHTDVKSELKAMLADEDRRIKFFALSSLLELGESVDAGALLDVAASAEMRGNLYARLEQFGKSDLFPAQFKTQGALAESDMVSWLMYPTELGVAPDEIELMKVVSVDTQTTDGLIDYYVFRYRVNPPNEHATNGWLAGVSGPYIQGTALRTHGLGGTFSAFTPYDKQSPEAHVGDTQQILDEWRAHHQQS